MIIQDFFPSAALKEWVQCYRIIHFEFDKAQQVPFKAYPPKPENCLHFFLRDLLLIDYNQKTEAQPSILFRGQHTSVVHQRAGNSFIDVQIVFQPTAVFRLTGLPAHELVNARLETASLFPKNIAFVLEELQHAGDYREMVVIVERYAKSLLPQARKEYLPLDLTLLFLFQFYFTKKGHS